MDFETLLWVFNLYYDKYKLYGSWSKTFRYYNDLLWLNYSIAGAIPLIILGIYKYRNPLKDMEQYNNNKPFPRTSTTLLEILFTFWCPIYYILDVCITLYENRVFDWCRWPFFYHHTVFVPVLICVTYKNYIPWFLLLLGGFHALLLAFPLIYELNYIYTGLIFVTHYCIYQKPYTQIYGFILMRKIYYLFYLAMVFLGLMDCKNVIPFL